MRRLSSALLSCAFVSALTAQRPQTHPLDVQAHMAHVEAGLLTTVIVQGDTNAAHTLEDRMRALHVPGVSIAVLHHGAVEWVQGYGVTAVGGAPVTPETVFQAGSISKPVAATAVLRLVQEGKLSLDADVNTLLTSWQLPTNPAANGKPVTLRELLTHTAGLTVHGFPGYAAGEPVPTLVQVLNGQKPANTPAILLDTEPGTRWNYSGGGYTVMQQLTIDQTHQPFDHLIETTVLKPIGMTHSTYSQPLPEAWKVRVATPYKADGTPIPGGAHTYPELAAAGLWTTPADLAKYLLELNASRNGKANHVLTQAITQQMLTPGLGNWGLGLNIGGTAPNQHFGHGGVNEGFESEMVMYEATGDGAVVMTNAAGGTELCDEILRSVAAEYGWPNYHANSRAAVALTPGVLADYAGTYRVSPKMTVTIVAGAKDRLLATGSDGRTTEYAPASETSFFALGAMPDIEFTRNAKGEVDTVVIHVGGTRTLRAERE